MTPITNADVAAVFHRYPKKMRSRLLLLRQLIVNVAAATEGVGKIEETLKWGERAYVMSESRSGSTVRTDRKKSDASKYAMHFHCKTNLVETFRTMFPDEFEYEGNRAIVFHDAASSSTAVRRGCRATAVGTQGPRQHEPVRPELRACQPD